MKKHLFIFLFLLGSFNLGYYQCSTTDVSVNYAAGGQVDFALTSYTPLAGWLTIVAV